jgi:hypothetical protein
MVRREDKAASAIYEIQVRGHLDSRWSDWFGGFELMAGSEGTILTGSVPDQAALHGVLSKIVELGLIIIYVKHLNHKADNHEDS